MAVGFAPNIGNSILAALCRNKTDGTDANTVALPIAAVYVQLHIGDPGAAGTANIAATEVRKQATFGTAAAVTTGAARIENTAALSWTDAEVDPATSETWTHFSAWNVSTAGAVGEAFLFSGTVTASAVNASGDSATIAIGGLDLSIPVATT